MGQTRNQKRQANWGGMNWIAQSSRLALYLRDGLACAYCNHSVEQGASLTLDHLVPCNDLPNGGNHKPVNLITACERCNKSRGTRKVADFAKAVAEYLNHDANADSIVAHIAACTARDPKPFRVQAKALIALRGTCKKVLDNLNTPAL
jgi:5-methylcytosine-specific restriction endonuclease McrA